MNVTSKPVFSISDSISNALSISLSQVPHYVEHPPPRRRPCSNRGRARCMRPRPATSPEVQSRRTAMAVVADIGSGSFAFFFAYWGLGRRSRTADGAAATATGEGHPPETDVLHVWVLSLPTTNCQKEKKIPTTTVVDSWSYIANIGS
jgi:hypothetical protein